MTKVAVLMMSGLADRINAVEDALEQRSPEEIDIFWLKYGGDYANVNFTDFFETKLNNMSITVNTKIISDIWYNKNINLEWFNREVTQPHTTQVYDKFFLSHGGGVYGKYMRDKNSILFTKHMSFKQEEIFTNSDFIGVHFRWYCPLRDDESYYNNIIESFEKIYDPSKKYFISTDSEKIQNYCARYPNIKYIAKKYNKKGFIDRNLENTKDTLTEINNLGNCGVIYRTMGGFAYVIAAQSKNKPSVLQLEVNEKYIKR